MNHKLCIFFFFFLCWVELFRRNFARDNRTLSGSVGNARSVWMTHWLLRVFTSRSYFFFFSSFLLTALSNPGGIPSRGGLKYSLYIKYYTSSGGPYYTWCEIQFRVGERLAASTPETWAIAYSTLRRHLFISNAWVPVCVCVYMYMFVNSIYRIWNKFTLRHIPGIPRR